VLVWEKKDFFSLSKAPGHGRMGVGGGADYSPMAAAEGLERGVGVHVDDGYNGFPIDDFS
jgi:hypothetical protein